MLEEIDEKLRATYQNGGRNIAQLLGCLLDPLNAGRVQNAMFPSEEFIQLMTLSIRTVLTNEGPPAVAIPMRSVAAQSAFLRLPKKRNWT